MAGSPVIARGILDAILAGYTLPVMGIHGVPHWARVLETGLQLAERTGADPDVVTLFAVFHDARRVNEGTDPEHGRRGADLAVRMRDELGLSDPQRELLRHACTHHTDGTTDGDVTVQTCLDADRLDLWRVGITPGGRWLCTKAARDPAMHAWTRERSLGDHLPEFAREWIRGGGV